jgi:dihydroxyacetone kinase-like predicted kinase
MDSISKNTLVDGLAKLTVMQEETRMKKERARMLRMLRHMTAQESQEPQEPQEMQEEAPMEGDPMAMENQGAQMPEAKFSERTPRAYKQIQEEMPEQYAHGAHRRGI